MGKLIYGFGINDADYVVCHRSGNCPYYERWIHMLRVCYGNGDRYQNKSSTVCEQWKSFSEFRKWMQTQDWKGRELDKDLFSGPDGEFSPSSCTFISRKTNKALRTKDQKTGLMGAYDNPTGPGYMAHFGGKRYSGFKTKLDAHLAYLNFKAESINELISLESNGQVKLALTKWQADIRLHTLFGHPYQFNKSGYNSAH